MIILQHICPNLTFPFACNFPYKPKMKATQTLMLSYEPGNPLYFVIIGFSTSYSILHLEND